MKWIWTMSTPALTIALLILWPTEALNDRPLDTLPATADVDAIRSLLDDGFVDDTPNSRAEIRWPSLPSNEPEYPANAQEKRPDPGKTEDEPLTVEERIALVEESLRREELERRETQGPSGGRKDRELTDPHLWERLQEIDRNSPHAVFELGVSAESQGLVLDSKRLFRMALQAEPDYLPARERLGYRWTRELGWTHVTKKATTRTRRESRGSRRPQSPPNAHRE